MTRAGLAVLLLAVLAACAQPAATAPAAAPRPAVTTAAPATVGTVTRAGPWLVAEHTRHSFGALVEGRYATYVFALTNTGTRDLVIDSVVASCTCVKTGWTRTPVPPGGHAEVKAILVPTVAGRTTATLTVASNASNGAVELTLTGLMRPTY
jgi:hypothetical protein